eukprot:175303_1
MAVSSVYFIPDNERDLVFGYIRIHCIDPIPHPITHLMCLYYYRLEEFSEIYKGKSIEMNELNHRKCRSISSHTQSIFGRIIAQAPYKYHWRLKWHHAQHSNIGFIDSTQHFDFCNSDFDDALSTYTLSIVDNSAGQIDLYLDLTQGTCSYIVDGMLTFDDYFADIDTTKQYVLGMSMKQADCTWEIISFETDYLFTDRLSKSQPDFYGMIGYCRSIADRKVKQKYYECMMLMEPHCKFLLKEYVECLIQEAQFMKAYHVIASQWNKYRYSSQDDDWIGFVAEQIYNLGDQYECALNLYVRISRKVLLETVWCGQLAHCYQKLGKNRKALSEYDMFLHQSKLNHNDLMRSNIEDNIGNVYFAIQDYQNAMKHAESAIRYQSDNCFALNNLGYYNWITGQYSEAEKCFRKCLEFDSKHQLANGNMANLLCEQNKDDEAMQYAEIAMTIEADMQHADIGPRLLLNYARVLYRKGEYNASLKVSHQLKDRNEVKETKDLEMRHKCYYLLSQNYWKLQQIHKGIEYIQKAVLLRPNNTNYVELLNQYRNHDDSN